MGSEAPTHVLLVSFPTQGHINPLLRLDKRLAANGLLVTFTTTEKFGKDVCKANSNITDQVTPDCPVSSLINNSFVPWVCDAAYELGNPNAVLWFFPYHYFHNLLPFPSQTEPKIDVQLPCLPLLKYDEVPEFLHPSSPFQMLGKLILGQFKNLSIPFCVLMDTFRELEHEIDDYMSNLFMVKPVGPLFFNPKAPKTIIRGDLLKADDCTEWLNAKSPASVANISFGSIAYIEQVNELAYGLLNSEISFLWIMKPTSEEHSIHKPHVLPYGFMEKVGNRGKVIQWSPQEEVLAYHSVACFVTHCGWNSSIEALTLGVPVVAFPQLSRGLAENRVILRDEIEKCLLEAMMGPKAEEMKRNTLEWKRVANEAVAEGGSSDQNIKAFVDEIRKRRAAVSLSPINNKA
ncbi:hypothetical protein I3843_06G160600 [Carya illinoinensis]|nr:hypothetical protein I3843_06G160600 [Carya illinoinensis]